MFWDLLVAANVLWLFISAVFGPSMFPAALGLMVWWERAWKNHFSIVRRQPRRSSDGNNPRCGVTGRPRPLRWSDLIACSGVAAWVTVPLTLLAPLAEIFVAEALLVFHPIACIGWWLHLRRHRVIHAEVYPLATWILAHVAWAIILTVDPSWVLLPEESTRVFAPDFATVMSLKFGIPSALAGGLWLAYVASGLVASIGAVVLARQPSPPFNPLPLAASWIPFACVTWVAGLLLGLIVPVMTVGFVGYGVSREVRRLQDESRNSGASTNESTILGASPKIPAILVGQTVAVVAIAVAITIWLRESGALKQFETIAAILCVMAIGGLVSGWLARRADSTVSRLGWAAGTFSAVSGIVAFQQLPGVVIPWIAGLFGDHEMSMDRLTLTIYVLPYVQALAVGAVASVLLVITFKTGHIMSYGAMLLGFVWVPIAMDASRLFSGDSSIESLIDPAGIAGATAMGCVILFVMWRYLGPGAIEDVRQDDVTQTETESEDVVDDVPTHGTPIGRG